MEHLVTLLGHMVQQDTPGHIQQIAEKTAHLALATQTREDTVVAARCMLMGLATLTDLDIDVRDALRQSPVPEVRAAVWMRPDVTIAELEGMVATEKRAEVLAKFLAMPQLPDPFVAALCAKMRRPIADVLIERGVVNAPVAANTAAAQLLSRSFHSMSSKNRAKVAFGVSERRLDANVLIVDERNIDPMLRLAACSNRRASIAVVEAHFARLLELVTAQTVHMSSKQADQHRSTVVNLLDGVAQRGDVTEKMLAAYRAHISGPQYHRVSREWNRLLNPVQAEQVEVTLTVEAQLEQDLNAAATPADLRAAFAKLAPRWQKEFASEFANSDLCDADLARDVLPLLEDRKRNTACGLWTFLDEAAFKDAVRASDARMVTRVVNLNDAIANVSDVPGKGTLIGWLLDVICHEPELVDTAAADMLRVCGFTEDRWRELLNDPDFPQDRFDEVPLFAVAAATRNRGNTPTWLWDAVNTSLGQLCAVRADLATTMLTKVASTTAPFGAVTAGVAAGLHN